MLPRQVRDRAAGEPVRVLSAGCSSGEEAYTLAIVHHENQFRCFGRPLEIHAIDLNPSRIRQAEQAEYEGLSFRAAHAGGEGALLRRHGEGRPLRGSSRG